jgi:hypothetical protein
MPKRSSISRHEAAQNRCLERPRQPDRFSLGVAHELAILPIASNAIQFISKDRSLLGDDMTTAQFNRRFLLAAGSSVVATGISGLLVPALAQSIAPTRSMSGGANNYRKGAPVVERIGRGGFWMSGTVRRAADGAPLAGQRIQIWAHTTEGYEDNVKSHGATLTDAKGVFRLEMPQIVPAFGQPHGHLAYDSGDFKTVFLRPVMSSAKLTSLEAHFVLEPV